MIATFGASAVPAISLVRDSAAVEMASLSGFMSDM